MRHPALLLPVLAVAAIALLTACGTKHIDTAEAESLCALYSQQHSLTHDQYADLIDVEQRLFADIQQKLRGLCDTGDSAAFVDAYASLRADTAFVSNVHAGETIWHVLVLGQTGFSQHNASEFATLQNPREIIDMLNEELFHRLRLYGL